MQPVGIEIWVRHSPKESHAPPRGACEMGSIGISWELVRKSVSGLTPDLLNQNLHLKKIPQVYTSTLKLGCKKKQLTPVQNGKENESVLSLPLLTLCLCCWVSSIIAAFSVYWAPTSELATIQFSSRQPFNQPLGIGASPAGDLVPLIVHIAVYLWF